MKSHHQRDHCLAFGFGILGCLLASTALGVSIWGVVRGGDAQNSAQLLQAQAQSMQAQVTTLQIQVLQTQVTLNDSMALPSAALYIATADSDGYGMVFHVSQTLSAADWYINFETTLWDTGGFWNASFPAYATISQTGRYALALDCPNVGLIDGATAQGRIQINYFDTRPGYSYCSTPLAVHVLTTAPASWEGNPYKPNAYAASLYVEAELSATGTSGVGTAFDLTYSPFVDYTTRPEISGSDVCTMYVRYLGPATGTPLVPVICFKK